MEVLVIFLIGFLIALFYVLILLDRIATGLETMVKKLGKIKLNRPDAAVGDERESDTHA